MNAVARIAAAIERGEPLRGLLVRLPGEDALTHAHRAGLEVLVVDLVAGPTDEAALHRLARSTHWAGLSIVVVTADESDHARFRTFDIDGLAVAGHGSMQFLNGPTCGFAIVDAAVEPPRGRSSPTLVVFDAGAALDELLSSFVAASTTATAADPVVLLPGMLGDPTVFDGVVAALPTDASSRPARIDLDASVGEMAESVLAGAPSRFALAGHSLGGIVALEVVRRAPRRVTKLALINTSARPPSESQQKTWATLRARTEAGEFELIAAEQAVVNLGEHASEELVERWVAMAGRVGPHGFIRQLDAQASRPDSRPSLGAISTPTLVISGEADAVCPPVLQRELADGISDCTYVTVPHAGHMSPLDHPREIADHLASWLDA